MDKRNIKIIVSYKGTNYHGFQRQPNLITIEDVINRAISKNLREDIEIIGAGRTDAGVHAIGQCASFKTSSSIKVEKIPRFINYDLPDDIRINSAKEVDEDFHPRHCAKSRVYRYTIYNEKNPSGYYNDIAWHVYKDIDINILKDVSRKLLGMWDFGAFVGRDNNTIHNIREILSIDISKSGPLIYIDIEGSSFLKNMIRIIVGTLVEISTAKRDVSHIKIALETQDRKYAGVTAPAKGLTLVEVIY